MPLPSFCPDENSGSSRKHGLLGAIGTPTYSGIDVVNLPYVSALLNLHTFWVHWNSVFMGPSEHCVWKEWQKLAADERLMIKLLRISWWLQQSVKLRLGPLQAWSPVRLHRSHACKAGAVRVDRFKNSLQSQPVGIRISRVGPRHVY